MSCFPVKPLRPRVWLDAPRLQWLKENPTRPDWKRLLANCEAGWLADTYNNALNYALVYKVTGSTRHAEKAAQLVELSMKKGMAAITPDHGFNARFLLPECAVSFDWLYDYLPAPTRQRWAEQIMAWADWCWLETNPTKGMPPRTSPDLWGQTNPGDNFYVGFLMSLIAALGVYGDHPKAAAHIDLGAKKLQELNTYLAKYGLGGYSLEGTQYGSWLRHGHLQAALLTACGQPAFPGWFLTDVVNCRPQVMSGDNIHMAPLGTQASAADAPVTEDHAGIALVGMSHGDEATKPKARQWVDGITYSRKRWNSWMAALWYDDRVKPALLVPPFVYHAPGSGYVSIRGPAGPWVIFQCGPIKVSHQDYSAGAFYIWHKGEWLTGPSRVWGVGGGLLGSEFNNVPLIERAGTLRGQPGQTTSGILPKDALSILPGSPVTTAGVTKVTGEASAGYTYVQNDKPVPVLKRWERNLVVQGNQVTVEDWFVKLNTMDKVLFQLQCKRAPQIQGTRYTVIGEAGRLLQGVCESPSGTPVLSVVPVMRGPGSTLSSYTLRITVPGGQIETRLTNRLEVVG